MQDKFWSFRITKTFTTDLKVIKLIITMKYTCLRGTKDILPEDIRYWHHIESISRKLFNYYNFEELRTPIFEMTELFERGIGDDTDIVEKEMYTFTDKGNRRITLRPEGTAPIVRAYLQNGLDKTSGQSKFYYCGPMFRYERPQAGRYRQFHQIGVENIGNEHPYADAEVIALGMHLFDELGLTGLSVSVNSVGCPVCRPVIEERLKQFIGANLKKLCGDCQKRFDGRPLRLLDCKNKKCKTYLTGNSNIHDSHCHECADHFSSVIDYIEAMGIPFTIDPTLVRGLDYYTRTTFEIVSEHLGAQNAICGGGRYDYLVEQFGGKKTPAVGFAFGVERAVMVLKQQSEIIQSANPLIYLIPLGDSNRPALFKLLNDLRRNEFKCEIDYSGSDLNKCLKKANKMSASNVIILGDDEALSQTVIVKNMIKRDQQLVALDKVVDSLNDSK